MTNDEVMSGSNDVFEIMMNQSSTSLPLRMPL